MKILLIGAAGQLGSALRLNNPGHDILCPDRRELDIERPDDAVALIRSAQPDIVVNCAAYHNVVLCETEPARAFLVNCVAIRDMAAACAALGAWFCTFSTDYVFGDAKTSPWHEDDLPSPLQIYGATRLAGEFAALWAAPRRSVVIRTCGLYGKTGGRSKGGNFVDNRLVDARAGKPIKISCEQTVSPTSADDLSRAVWALLGHENLQPGIYHLVNEGGCSWYEFSREIVRLIDAPVDVIPVDREGRSGNMRRPRYSVLANTRARALGITLRPWQDALRDYLLPQHTA